MRKHKQQQLRSVLVSYRRADAPIVTSRTGYGETYSAALLDADRQLADGIWKRLVVSTPSSIRRDIDPSRIARLARRTLQNGEGITIRVERCVSEVLDVE